MKPVISILAMLAVAGCGGLSKWSYAGLEYSLIKNAKSGDMNSFTGIAQTTIAEMPATGSAAYTGEYRVRDQTKLLATPGKGPATLAVDFAGQTVQLDLTGDLNRSAAGTMTDNTFTGASVSDSFFYDGQFYGSTAEVAAGVFYDSTTSLTGEETLLFGEFITEQ